MHTHGLIKSVGTFLTSMRWRRFGKRLCWGPNANSQTQNPWLDYSDSHNARDEWRWRRRRGCRSTKRTELGRMNRWSRISYSPQTQKKLSGWNSRNMNTQSRTLIMIPCVLFAVNGRLEESTRNATLEQHKHAWRKQNAKNNRISDWKKTIVIIHKNAEHTTQSTDRSDCSVPSGRIPKCDKTYCTRVVRATQCCPTRRGELLN